MAWGIARAAGGRYYVTDAVAKVVRELTLDGATRWVAGRPLLAGFAEPEANDGSAREAIFSAPVGIAVTEDERRIYVAERYRIRVIE